MPPDPKAASSAHLTLAAARARLDAAVGPRFVELFRHESLVVEYYAPLRRDPQTPHSRDEVYVVAQGNAEFFDGATRRKVAAGDLLFVAAERVHRFEDFSSDFGVWVMFYGPEGGEGAP